MRVAVYTAIFGDKDALNDPLNYDAHDCIDYYVFSDNISLSSKVYKLVHRQIIFDDVTKNARYYKVLGDDLLSGYDFVIWHDGNIQMNHAEIHNLLSYLQPGDAAIATFKHPVRNNFYDEGVACVRHQKDSALIVTKQILKYFSEKLPVAIGLFETTILAKRNCSKYQDFYREWWQQINSYSRRDQLALTYALWKTHQSVSIIPGRGLKNSFSTYQGHRYGLYYKKGKKSPTNSRISIAAVTVLFRLLKLIRSSKSDM